MKRIWMITLVVTLGWGQTQTKVQRVEMQRTYAGSGEEMYSQYCASCHGMDGKGAGPAAVALREAVPDLTKMAQNNGGEFPAASVMMTLGRIEGPGAHGSKEMPVWGHLFRGSGDNEPIVQIRIYNLTRYIESLQDPPSRKVTHRKAEKTERVNPASLSPVSGSIMYVNLCAACHGETGLGDGPAGVALKNMPTDLTMLTRANNGNFPSSRVREILDRDPGTAAHGTAQMPVWGDVFRRTGENPSLVMLRIANLVSYVKSLQR